MKEVRIPLPRALREVLAEAGYTAELVARRDDGQELRDIDERNLKAHIAAYEVDHETEAVVPPWRFIDLGDSRGAIPVNTPEDIAAARQVLRGEGRARAPVYEIPRSPLAGLPGNPWRDVRKTDQLILAADEPRWVERNDLDRARLLLEVGAAADAARDHNGVCQPTERYDAALAALDAYDERSGE